MWLSFKISVLALHAIHPQHSRSFITPRACARGKVIGRVVVVDVIVIVVVSTNLEM